MFWIIYTLLFYEEGIEEGGFSIEHGGLVRPRNKYVCTNQEEITICIRKL